VTGAPKPLDRRTLRPAAFVNQGALTRGDVTGEKYDRIRWVTNAAAAIRRLNDVGYFVFVISSETGVANGSISQGDMGKLQVRIRIELLQQGARVDDLRSCPYPPQATVAAYKRDSDWRIPKPGMILDLMRYWPVNLERSFVIGDAMDIKAAQAAQIAGHLFRGEDLLAFIEGILRK
jgi:D-glycero-D-manno-heptose 1,7-bisphosphate phosphatase